ncbi:MAG: energy-coupling factor ABC transporter substrate-binding protein [Fibrobacterota bacterium]|nr:energy-coupling factor ABC transporter substrate-binding protein [Fibrobacterota bacterium]QQS07694.1 MAG: energy-coupling factor ABC transporter substrate-binding protein [Fibrobacterota bacterium]
MGATTKNALLLGAAVALAVFALAIGRPSSGEAFAGADALARAAINEIDPGYKPWFSPLWEPPSGEIESLIFGLQAASGAGVLCYALGFWRGRRRPEGKNA